MQEGFQTSLSVAANNLLTDAMHKPTKKGNVVENPNKSAVGLSIAVVETGMI